MRAKNGMIEALHIHVFSPLIPPPQATRSKQYDHSINRVRKMNMLLSKLIGNRYREMPADAKIASHAFMLKGAYIRPVANGMFTLLPPARRITQKIEQIIREEMDALQGQEVLFPVVLPRELWDQSGRYETVGKELLRFSDRTGGELVLGMTHEEAAVYLAKTEAKSYTGYPFMIYQIQTKFRDEPRARGGLIRVREFTMKDAYSFHLTQQDLDEYYQRCHQAYQTIYRRCGIPEVISVGSDSGMMGGAIAHEFMLLCDAGEDTIITCSKCDYKANMEVACCSREPIAREAACVEKIHTPGQSTIEDVSKFLNKPACQIIKAAVFSTEQSGRTILCFLRADLEVNEAKLRAVVHDTILPLNNPENTGLTLGYCGPYQLKASSNVEIFYDQSLQGCHDMVAGANQADYHYAGLSVSRDFQPEQYVDIAKVREGDQCPVCGAPLKVSRGIEVGNIFQLGTKYTQSMNMTYTDQNGSTQHPIMGCYGIGIGRLAACVAEAQHDEYGPIWPYSIAPWQIHICALSSKQQDVTEQAQALYQQLSAKYETILDDRKASAGIQFADADLLGVPIRVIVSARNLKNHQVEIVTRDKTIQTKVDLNAAMSAIDQIAAELMDRCQS